MAFRRKVDDCIEMIPLEKRIHQRLIPDITLHKAIPGILFHGHQVLQVSRIGQQIQIHQKDVVLLVLQYILDKIGADKPRPAGNKYVLHFPSSATFSKYCPYSVLRSGSARRISASFPMYPLR